MTASWQIRPIELEISSRYIDIWLVKLDVPDDAVRRHSDLLCADELVRANKFMSEDKAREFIVTRAALRTILADVLHRQPLDLKFDTDANGKPGLLNNGSLSHLYFNISHSHELALIAVTSGNQIGIDIEKIRTDIDHENLSRRFFSDREFEQLQQIREELRLIAFFATWTRKEAVVKAIGKGLAKNLKQFDVTVDPYLAPQILARVPKSDDFSRLYLATVDIDVPYYASLAATCPKNEAPLIRHWIF